MARKREDADLIVRLTSFSLPVVGTENKMSYESFMDNVVNSPKFNKRLDNGLIMGLFTHAGRDETDANRSATPYDDLIAKHKDLCNVCRDVWVSEDSSGKSAYASLDLLDGLESTELVKVLIKKNLFVGVSMATRSNFDSYKHEYMIRDLKGVDFTRDPAFIGSGVVKQNFSGGDQDVNFSAPRIEQVPAIVHVGDSINFAFRDWLREVKRPRYMILQGRIRDVIRTLKSMNPDDIVKYRLDIQAYVNDLIYNSISLAMESDKRININVLLRIMQFLDDSTSAQMFNTKINLVKNLYRNQGYMTKSTQAMLQEAMEILLSSLWRFISNRSGVKYEVLRPQATPRPVIDKGTEAK
jgi:hypothetical protein